MQLILISMNSVDLQEELYFTSRWSIVGKRATLPAVVSDLEKKPSNPFNHLYLLLSYLHLSNGILFL
jgi:hypothetical protein